MTKTVTAPAAGAADRTVTHTVTESAGAQASPTDAETAAGAGDTVTSPLIALSGTAQPILSDSSTQPVSVVAQGAFDGSALGGSVPIVVRNNSGGPINDITATGSAEDESGTLVGSGSDQGFTPDTVGPGDIAIGYVYFGDESVASATTFTVEVDAEPGTSDWTVDLPISDVNHAASNILGKVHNDTNGEVSGPISVAVMCFTPDGTILGSAPGGGSYAAKSDLGPGADSPFSVDLFDTSCPTFLIGASGYAR